MSFDVPKAIADGITCTTIDRTMDDSDFDDINGVSSMTPMKPPAQGATARFVGPLKAEEVRWFYKKTPQDKTWLPLNGRDSLAIEAEYRKRQQADKEPEHENDSDAAHPSSVCMEQSQPVVVLGGLYRLSYETGEFSESPLKSPASTMQTNKEKHSPKSDYYLRPIYWEGDCLLLTRGTWFLEAAGGDWQPLDADSVDLVQKMERKHLAIFAKQRIPETSVYFDKGPRPVLCEVCDMDEEKSPGSGAKARWHSVIDVVLFNNSRSSLLWRYLKMTSSGTKLMRGYHTEAKYEDGPPPVTHLLFVIHGIGQKRQRNRIVTNATSMREVADQLIRSSYPSLRTRPMFLPVDWRSELQLDEELISSITPNYLEHVRGFFNESLLDLLYYASPSYGPEVVTGLCTVLNRMYRLFISNDPGFLERGGRISLVAHSLGAVITYDILTSGWNENTQSQNPDRISVMPRVDQTACRLDFTVQHLFCFGSPLGVFLAARRRHGLFIIEPVKPEGKDNRNFRLHNIYHPADPVAYRIEPLVSEIYATVRPQRIHRFNAAEQPPYETIAPEILVTRATSQRSRSPSPPTVPREHSQQPSRAVDSEDNASGFESDEGPSTSMQVTVAASSMSPPPKRSWSAAVFGRFGMSRVEKETAPLHRSSSPDFASVVNAVQVAQGKAEPADTPKAAEQADEATEMGDDAPQQSTPEGKGEKSSINKDKLPTEAMDIPPRQVLPYRIDFTLRQGRMEYAYWAAIVSHVSYWANHDAVMYVLSALYGSPKSGAMNK